MEVCGRKESTFKEVTQDLDPANLLECAADEKLFDEAEANLPQSVGRPEPIPPSRTRARVVGIGATLTGFTLLAGIALLALGAIDAISSGLRLLDLFALALGAALIGTHWGWVHVAEASAGAIESRRNRELHARRGQWLQSIEPYTHYEVSSRVEDDGSISIVRVRHRPARSGERSFTFVREIESREVHSSEEPAAAVAERAELLRRKAALDTERERRRFAELADAHQMALLGSSDERQRLAARRAASEALSEQINSKLRDPPLVE